jgi:membrane-associated phospholipid phosphatase
MTGVTDESVMRAPAAVPSTWGLVVQSLTRPYPVSPAMVAFVALVPFYIFIGGLLPGRTIHTPALAWDALVPLRPTWALVYGSLYLFLIVLPVFVVRQREHVRRTVLAYLTVWLVAYVCFLVYPTIAPRPARVVGTGFVAWGLRFLYSADPPYNCFPSLHVAHSFVSAFACYPVHRKVGLVATLCAAVVGLSTLYAKQHYILDVLAGGLLASIAYLVFLRNAPRDDIPELDRHLAPVFALGVVGVVLIAFACVWVAYRWSGAA